MADDADDIDDIYSDADYVPGSEYWALEPHPVRADELVELVDRAMSKLRKLREDRNHI